MTGKSRTRLSDAGAHVQPCTQPGGIRSIPAPAAHLPRFKHGQYSRDSPDAASRGAPQDQTFPQAERQGRSPDSQREDPTTPTSSGRGWAWLKGEGGAPSNGNSNRSCTNGSLITINYHFRLKSSAAEPPLRLFCSPLFIQPRTFRRTKAKETENYKRSNESPPACLRRDHMATRVY